MDTDIALTEKQLGEHAGTHQSIGLPARSAASYVNYLLQIGSWYPANVLRWPARHKPSRRLAQGGVKGGEAVSRSEIGDP